MGRKKEVTVLRERVAALEVEREELVRGLFEALKPQIEELVHDQIEEAMGDVEVTFNYQGV